MVGFSIFSHIRILYIERCSNPCPIELIDSQPLNRCSLFVERMHPNQFWTVRIVILQYNVFPRTSHTLITSMLCSLLCFYIFQFIGVANLCGCLCFLFCELTYMSNNISIHLAFGLFLSVLLREVRNTIENGQSTEIRISGKAKTWRKYISVC